MARPSRLLYLTTALHQQGGAESGDEVCSCPDGIPLGWVMLFGGRNYWEPDEQVAARGGAVGDRTRFETPIEVAEARLTNAISSLRSSEHLWVWFAALEILRLRIKGKGKTGVLRLEAPWALDNATHRDKTSRATAFAENYVNMVSVDRIENIPQYVAPLDKICPFVPYCKPDDHARFRKAAGIFKEYGEPAQAAALLVGIPQSDHDKFLRRVTSVYEPEFTKIPNLPPYPEVKARMSYSSTAVQKNIPLNDDSKAAPSAEKPKGLIGRLKRIVGR
ncbi:MAG: hypothetical protein PWP23_3114 [Candidatus Sumerlaeota bacterium]|nr:hypothetical protein [Candidatus Sumerlaeota bacterium]